MSWDRGVRLYVVMSAAVSVAGRAGGGVVMVE